MKPALLGLALAVGLSGTAYAQRMSVSPPARDGFESSCRVSGLNPRGDNFLAIRSGPGSRYRKVGEVYTNYTMNMDRPCPNRKWCYSDQIYDEAGNPVRLRGYFFNRYCPVFAG